ncbi:chemotaxis-specific protein-glutamate methyltransferase CheB [Erythrobacter sp. JK5]|nr:chemotaxis-specific protein-glutamate methyltransferase CheB [Erythrobacter sp. JK5]
MIVDDSLTVRTILKRMVESDRALQVVDTASSAERAIFQLRTTRADVILLDLEMPGMGGLDALPTLLDTAAGAQVLVVSSLTEAGAEHTMAALSMGAADTMLKPRPGEFTDAYRSQLVAKIRALGGREEPRAQAGAQARAQPETVPDAVRSGKCPEVLAIGASTGGIHALNQMLRTLPPEFDLPILITQHLPDSFIPVFARQVEMAGARRALVASEGTEIRRGEIVIASGNGHMVIHRVGDRLVARVSCDPAASGCLPSVDPMLSSVARACDGAVLAVLLSGMGRDGADGAREVFELGGTVFAQDAGSCAVWGMPGAVVKAGIASRVAPPEALGDAIVKLARVRASSAS